MAAAKDTQAAIFLPFTRSATVGTNAIQNRTAPNTNPANSPICNPEIANKCARLAPRKASVTSSGIALRSPVVTAAANPATSAAIRSCIAPDKRIRNPKIPPLLSGVAIAKTGTRVYPTAPICLNQAWR